MGIDGTASNNSFSNGLPLLEVYRALDNQRIDIDRHINSLAPDDPARDPLWIELDQVLAELRQVIGQLARAPAPHLPELQAKAAVLATLLRPEDNGHGDIIPEADKLALALSLADDITRLSGG